MTETLTYEERVAEQDALTRRATEAAKREVARDFSSWLQSGALNAVIDNRFAVQYATERALAGFVARTIDALGDYVARGALIESASLLSTYIDPESFHAECVWAIKQRGRK